MNAAEQFSLLLQNKTRFPHLAITALCHQALLPSSTAYASFLQTLGLLHWRTAQIL